MIKTIKIIAALIVFTVVNVAAVIYLNNYLLIDKKNNEPTGEPIVREPVPKEKHTHVQEKGLRSQEAMVLAAALDQVLKEARMRDTVIAQQVMRIQHKLEMHKQRVQLCPDCVNVRNNSYIQVREKND